MQTLKFSLFAAAAAAIALAPAANAFHSGGVAECEGCHTMHNTRSSGRAVPAAGGVGNGAKYLLQGSDQSSTCLNCHNAADTAPSSYHISTDDSMLAPGKPPVEMTPGGDFAWLKKNTTYSGREGTATVYGQERGHNIVAADYGYTSDTTNLMAPGGTYPAASLACTSCHDPHSKYRRDSAGNIVKPGDPTARPIVGSGSYNTSLTPDANYNVGVYRILGGAGYFPKSVGAAYAFGATTNPPVAIAPSSYNRSEGVSQTHVAYGSGMSEWCANCHGEMHQNTYSSGVAGQAHPAGNGAKLTAAVMANYNSYLSSGILTNTDLTKAYSTLAPFELGKGNTVADIKYLQALAVTTDTVDQSASTTANVMCLSCHRAHASGFQEMTRFYLENEFMTYDAGLLSASSNAVPNGVAVYDGLNAGPGSSGNRHLGLTQAETQAAYYGRPASWFGPMARNYCNKCHAKD